MSSSRPPAPSLALAPSQSTGPHCCPHITRVTRCNFTGNRSLHNAATSCNTTAVTTTVVTTTAVTTTPQPSVTTPSVTTTAGVRGAGAAVLRSGCCPLLAPSSDAGRSGSRAASGPGRQTRRRRPLPGGWSSYASRGLVELRFRGLVELRFQAARATHRGSGGWLDAM